MDSELLSNIEALANKGLRLSRSQILMLEHCYQEPLSIQQLSKKLNISYPSAYRASKLLVENKLLVEAFYQGRESYWRCKFDVSETADVTFHVRWMDKNLTFEELLGILEGEEYPFNIYARVTKYALLHLYRNSLSRADGREAITPSGVEVKTLLNNVAKFYEEFANVIRSISNLPLFSPDDEVHTLMGDISNQDFVSNQGQRLHQIWNKQVSVKGFTADRMDNEIRAQAREVIARWEAKDE
jgi:Fe2+ or Zn2+ uptake regulation protein